MNDLTFVGNLAEAAVWFFVAAVLLVKALHSARQRAILLVLAVAFLLFGVSDVIESHTGAWWRPPWLLVLKAGCVIVFVVGFYLYLRRLRERQS